MKTLFTITGLLAVLTINAQSYKLTPQGNSAETTLVIKEFYADLVIEGVTGGELIIETSDYEGIPDKAKGLKPLSATGPENTGIGLSVHQEGNRIIVGAASRNANDGTYYLKVPKNMKLMADVNSWQAGDIVIKGMASDVEVKTQNADLRLENVTGPIIANSLSSDIVVVFSSVNQNSPTSLSSTSGDIDITLPATTKGNFSMSSISGEVYTDLDFKFGNDKDLTRFGGGMSAKASLNGGGVEISLKCISGDVYIRKAK